jgi:hypothetical protein
MIGAPRANSRGAPSKSITSSLLRVGRRPGDRERVRRRRIVETRRDVVHRHRDDVVACRCDIARGVVGLARTGEPSRVFERRVRETPELGAEHDLHVVTVRSRHIGADVGVRLVDEHLLRLRDVLDGRWDQLVERRRGSGRRLSAHDDDGSLGVCLGLALDRSLDLLPDRCPDGAAYAATASKKELLRNPDLDLALDVCRTARRTGEGGIDAPLLCGHVGVRIGVRPDVDPDVAQRPHVQHRPLDLGLGLTSSRRNCEVVTRAAGLATGDLDGSESHAVDGRRMLEPAELGAACLAVGPNGRHANRVGPRARAPEALRVAVLLLQRLGRLDPRPDEVVLHRKADAGRRRSVDNGQAVGLRGACEDRPAPNEEGDGDQVLHELLGHTITSLKVNRGLRRGQAPSAHDWARH